MENKTYVEVRGKKPFNWYKALNEKEIDWEDLKNMASNWVTCACGNQCDVIPRDFKGEPEDSVLSALGGHRGFYGAIIKEDVKEALCFLNLIEVYSAKLIKKIKGESH